MADIYQQYMNPEIINKIDELGGAVMAIEQEFQQNEIASSAFDFQNSIDEGEQILVGVNKYATKKVEKIDTQEIDEASIHQQLIRLNELKINRDNDTLKQSLTKLKDIASKDENLIPQIINSVKNHTTLGEISDTLRKAFGEF